MTTKSTDISATPIAPGTLPEPVKVLKDAHRAELHASGISDATIAAAGIYSAEGKTVTDILGFKPPHSHWGPCTVYPYPDAAGQPTDYARVKPSWPRHDESGKRVKYESPKGKPNRAYFPPHFAERFKTATIVLIVEGEKKALSLDEAGYCVIGLVGVWAWQRKRPRGDTGKAFGPRRLIPDLESLDFKGKVVHIVFDSDAADNDAILLAEHALATLLANKGVAVKVVRIPPAGDAKVGADDYIVANGVDAFRSLVTCSAEPQKPPVPSPLQWARMFVDEFFTGEHGAELKWWRDEFFRWDHRRYIKLDHSELCAIVLPWLDERTSKATPRQAKEIVEAMQALCRVPFNIEQPSWMDDNEDPKPRPTNIIPVHNGLLDITNTGGEMVIYDHTPEFFSPIVLPYRYEANATCPTWEKHLESVFKGDVECIRLLQSWFGLCLTTDTSFQKFLLMHGPTRAGKGLIIRVLEKVVGSDNCVSPTLSSLASDFGLWPLIGKSVASFADAHLSHRADSMRIMETIKSIVGEDAVSINRKNLAYLPNVHLKLFIVITANELPRFSDASDALGARMLPLPFEESFAGREDRTLEKRLGDEIQGIFNWSLRGLAQLRAVGRFIIPKRSADLIENYRRLTSPVTAFVEDCCTTGPTQDAPVDDLYLSYIGWCRANGHTECAKPTFGSHLSAAYPTIQRRRRRVESGAIDTPDRQYVYAGVSLTSEGQMTLAQESERRRVKSGMRNEE